MTVRIEHGPEHGSTRARWHGPIVVVVMGALAVGLSACGSDTGSPNAATVGTSARGGTVSSPASDPVSDPASDPVTAGSGTSSSPQSAQPNVDPCSLLTVAEIEAVVGPGVEQGGFGKDLPGRCTYSVGGDVGAGVVAISLEDPLVCAALQRAVDSGSAGQAVPIDVGEGGFVETYGTVEFLVGGGGCVSISGSTDGQSLSQEALISLATTAAPRAS
jgi:hypothetical protein